MSLLISIGAPLLVPFMLIGLADKVVSRLRWPRWAGAALLVNGAVYLWVSSDSDTFERDISVACRVESGDSNAFSLVPKTNFKYEASFLHSVSNSVR